VFALIYDQVSTFMRDKHMTLYGMISKFTDQ